MRFFELKLVRPFIFYSLFSIFLGISLFCNAQIITGTVSDKGEQALAFATVSLRQEEQIYSTRTDERGHFQLHPDRPGKFELNIFAVGFQQQKKILEIKKDTVLNLIMAPLQGKLQEIKVTGSRSFLERKPDRVIFHVREGAGTAGGNGIDILRKVPGLNINGDQISLAGKGEMSIMLDGRLLHLSGKTLTDFLSTLSSGQIDKIEIITNPSSNYDAEGAAGIVDIKTSRGEKTGWSGTISGAVKKFFYKNQPNYNGVKNYGDFDEGIGIYYNNEKWSAYANANNTGGRELWGYGIGVDYPDKRWDMGDTGAYDVETFSFVSGLDYNLNKTTTIGFEYNYGYHMEEGADYVKVPVYGTFGDLDSTIRTYATYHPVAKSNGFNLHLIQKLGESGAEMRLNADYFNFFRTDWSDLYSQSFDPSGSPKNEVPLMLTDTAKQNIKISTFKTDFSLPASILKLNFGGKLSFIDNYSNIFYYDQTDGHLSFQKDISNEFRYIENTQALYIDGSKKIGRWQLRGGLRGELTETKARSYFDHTLIKKTRFKLFPTFLATFEKDEDHSFTFSYNKRIHRPSFWNLNPYKTFMTPFTYVEGNPYLEPEYLTNTEISHHYKNKLTSTFYLSAVRNGFAQIIEKQDTGPYLHVTGMLNFYSSNRIGLRESYAWAPLSWFESDNTGSFFYTRVHSKANFISGISGWGGYFETSNKVYFDQNKRLSGFISFWYQFPEIQNSGKTTHYYDVDAGLQIKALQNRLSLSLIMTDLFQSSASALVTEVKDLKTTYTNFQLNSQIRLAATWQFGQKEGKKADTGNEDERERID